MKLKTGAVAIRGCGRVGNRGPRISSSGSGSGQSKGCGAEAGGSGAGLLKCTEPLIHLEA